jgi:membrane protein YqaA with SNARE-associated domain
MRGSTAGQGTDGAWTTGPRAQLVALAWGFAEATVFFVVPDVWISRLALSSRGAALRACAAALAGAIAGGLLLYALAPQHGPALLAFFDHLPAIGPGLIGRVQAQLRELGGAGLVLGGFSGAPYKLYAVQAPAAGLGWAAFAACSVVARGARFVAGALLARGLARWLAPRLGEAMVRRAWWVAWVVFYAAYWTLMPG